MGLMVVAARFGMCEDISRPDSFRAHLLAIARIEWPMETDRRENAIGDHELEIREPQKTPEIETQVALAVVIARRVVPGNPRSLGHTPSNTAPGRAAGELPWAA